MNHLVSIIVPCYNQAQYLDEALESVLNQIYADWECIIINDGSIDNTDEIAKNWLNIDHRFKYIDSDNKGVCHARNLGIAKSKGNYILPLDADDKISKNYVSLAIQAFNDDQTLTLVYCKAEKFGDDIGEWFLKPFSFKALAEDNMIFCSAIYKKTDWERIGGYSENMLNGLEDWEFWIAMLKDGGQVLRLKETCFYYRIKENSRQKELFKESKKPLFDYISIKHVDFFVKQLGSFIELNINLKQSQNKDYKNIKSKKIAIDLFCKTFFGFTIFKTLN